MLGMLVLALADLDVVLTAIDVTAAMSIEALLGTDRAFAADLMALRPHPGQTTSAENLRRLLDASPIVASHRIDDPRVQDAYSLRCTPQVHGAARDAVTHAARVADIELHSAIDNPTLLPDGRVESCGHFHGAPIAQVCDFLAIAVADAGSIAERRTDRLLDRTRSQGLPPFLVEDAGVNSGVMIVQYTQAAMVAENRRLAVPASVDSVPTSAMQEDHVSMGWGAARKLRRAVANLGRIVACELVCAARGLELRAPLAPGPGHGSRGRRTARRGSPRRRPRPVAGPRARPRRAAGHVGRTAASGRGGHRPARLTPRHLVTLRLKRRSGHSPSRYEKESDQIGVRCSVDAVVAEGDRDAGPGAAGLGHDVLPLVLAGAAHHQQVTLAEVEHPGRRRRPTARRASGAAGTVGRCRR